MKCFNCGEKITGTRHRLNADGDFACSERCQREYEQKKDRFFREIVHNEELMKLWWKGEIR